MFHGGWWEVYLEIEFVAGSSARLLGTGRREAAPPAAVLAVTPGREQRPWRPGALDVSASCQPQRCWEPSPAPQCPQPCSRPILTHTSVEDSWTLMGKSESVSSGVSTPLSWVLVHTSFCLCLPRVCVPSPV